MKKGTAKWGLAAALVFVSLAAPAAADAVTYCVHQGGSCPAGQVDEGTNLQRALDHAGESSGNTVLIGAGTFTHDDGFTFVHGTPGPDVTISGAGAGQTVLAATSEHPATGYVLGLQASAASTLTGITVHVQKNDGGGLDLNTATASAVAIEIDKGGLDNHTGAFLTGGATIEHSTIRGPPSTTCCTPAAMVSNGDVGTLIDDTLSNGWEGIEAVAPTAMLTGRDLRIVSPVGILANEGTVTVDDMLAVLSPPENTAGLEAYQGGTLTARSATVIGAGAPGSRGVMVYAAGGDSALTFNDSIIAGFPVGYERLVNGSGGTAELTLDNDDAPAGMNNAAGAIEQKNYVEADPLFVDPAIGDYHLRFGSPAIDTGNACNSICETVPDLDGLTRPIDGNGDGTATRDMGAYEYGHRAPIVTATLSSPSHGAGQDAAFAATASDPDPGDTVSLTWGFDDGAHASGAAVAHAFAKPGTHTATVTATDSSGLTSSATVTANVPAANTKITKAKIDSKAGSATFHFEATGTAGSYQCELRRKGSKRQPKFGGCRSPKAYKHLKPGSYTFEVRALEAAGAEPTPAKRAFTLH